MHISKDIIDRIIEQHSDGIVEGMCTTTLFAIPSNSENGVNEKIDLK